MDNPDRQGASLGYYIYMYAANNKNVAVELLPKYKRTVGAERERYYYALAKNLGVAREFVTALFEKEKNKRTPGKLDIGSKIRSKSGLYKRPRKKPFKTKDIAKNMVKIKTHRQECTANRTPMCLKVFVTNQEDTVCLRCQNVRV